MVAGPNFDKYGAAGTNAPFVDFVTRLVDPLTYYDTSRRTYKRQTDSQTWDRRTVVGRSRGRKSHCLPLDHVTCLLVASHP